MKLRRKRFISRGRGHGAAIAEFAGAVVILLPLFIVLAYSTYEFCLYLYIKTSVDACARMQARWLALNFNTLCQDGATGFGYSFGSGIGSFPTWISPNIRAANAVVSSTQFVNGTIDRTNPANPQFLANVPPPTAVSPGALVGQGQVAVQVTFPGSTGMVWPNPPIQFFGRTLIPPCNIVGTYACDVEP